jgi:hypothetical protein
MALTICQLCVTKLPRFADAGLKNANPMTNVSCFLDEQSKRIFSALGSGLSVKFGRATPSHQWPSESFTIGAFFRSKRTGRENRIKVGSANDGIWPINTFEVFLVV